MGATDPDALLGVLWDDDGDPANDDVAYEFKTGYTIPGVDAEGRASYIDEIVRDAEYARRTAVDIGLLIDEIREGRDHLDDYYRNPERSSEDEPQSGQDYGHEPDDMDAPKASLKEFVDAGSQGVAVLVRAQGISKGIADAALNDIEAIEAAIARIDAYREKAEDAKKALEDEARRLREVEIVALIGRDRSDDSNQRILGGSAGEKLDESNRLRQQARDLEGEISMLQDEFDGLEVEVSELQTWLENENPDLLNLPVLASSEGPACDSVATCRTVWEDKRKERDEKKGEIDSKKESMTEDGVMTTRADRLVKMADDLLAESEADEQKADDLRKEADRLETTEAQGIQDEIDSIRAEKAKLQKELENDGTDGEALGDKNDLAREDGAGYDLDGDKDENRVRLESRKAQNVLDYLEGQFKNATASDAILLGEGANFSVLRERERDDKNSVFARAPVPEGTVDAWAALEIGEDTITITVPTRTGDPNYARRTDIALLRNTIGEHRAKLLEGGKPAAGDFTLADPEGQRMNYDAATGGNGDIGKFFEGTYKGVHGTLYVYDWFNSENGLTESRWFFTPTTARGDEGIRLRGRNPELFRYMDEDGDGTFELVPFVDYGMWLEGDTTLILRLLAGIVGPQESVDDLGTVVDVHGVRDRDNPHLDATATYSGTAKGLSARRTDGVTASGHFEADVSLSATFGADATLEGRIDNFRSADPEGQGTAHVNSDWRADLDSSPLADRNLGDTDGNPNTPDEMEEGGRVVKGTVSGPGSTSGEWSGVAYGRPGSRTVNSLPQGPGLRALALAFGEMATLRDGSEALEHQHHLPPEPVPVEDRPRDQPGFGERGEDDHAFRARPRTAASEPGRPGRLPAKLLQDDPDRADRSVDGECRPVPGWPGKETAFRRSNRRPPGKRKRRALVLTRTMTWPPDSATCPMPSRSRGPRPGAAGTTRQSPCLRSP